VRLPVAMVEALDKLAARAKGSRSGLIRQFIEAGLKRRPMA
jgi:metal-responsive CopG/Arc/MetJ family transcriptional regulator